MKKELVAAGFVILTFMSPLKVLAKNISAHIDKIYVFGDSLSDAGNLYNATNRLLPPSPPYFQGRFSNGPVWVEYLGEELDLTPTLFTNLQSTTLTDPGNEGINYAFGGATSGLSYGLFDPEIQFPGVLGQVGLFTQALKETNQLADPNGLYIVWGGANDYLSGSTTTVNKTITNLSTAISFLALAGAKNIMVVNLPDLGKTPFASNIGNVSQLSILSQEHNKALTVTLYTLDTLPGVNIIPVDAASIFNRVLTKPKQFGITNTTQSCLTASSQEIAQGSSFSVCDQPDEYLFWDDVHPTTRIHRVFAKFALAQLKKSIHEPWQQWDNWQLKSPTKNFIPDTWQKSQKSELQPLTW